MMLRIQTVLLSIIWAGIFGTMTQLGHEKEIQTLDPWAAQGIGGKGTVCQYEINCNAFNMLNLRTGGETLTVTLE